MIKKFSVIILILMMANSLNITEANATRLNKAVGKKGQILKVSQINDLQDHQLVTVRGKKYSMNLGIYVAYCVLPKPGKKPENCYGGINLDGNSDGSIWISSNPPIYAKFLAKPFWSGGRFKVQIEVTRKIGDFNCLPRKCVVLTRADHTNSDNRSADVFVPVSFK